MKLFERTVVKTPPGIQIIVDGQNLLGKERQKVDWYYSEVDETLVIHVNNSGVSFARLNDAWRGFT